MKMLGARRHPMSGAGNIKWDGDSDTHLFEIKKVRRSFTMSGRYLRDLFVCALRQEKSPTIIVRFDDADVFAIINIVAGAKGVEFD